MGIPKFYRWLSERYPCLSEVLKEYQIPEFDNLYLDMNGIIHTCSHPDDSSIYIQVPESKIFSDICHYIEVLFRMIKPQKVFYMAIDGVAPRAKMNQQRSRRFRSAKEAELIMMKELRKGGAPPTGTRFDSNCITPGTEFMTRLDEVLKQFIASKVKSDPMWQRPLIIFSGHEAPGEGEHKVMDFIRSEKSRPGFDPNTRHCLYGLDADLIMLSLVTHEPHFSLLREEVKFTKKENQKRSILPEETTFHLLHISILRDYLNLEFASLQKGLSFGYDLERIIDDWVLMGFLVGNDFVPHLPNLHIHHDCLPVLWTAYKEILPSLGGYINEGGTLNLERFELYLTELHQFDYEKFEEHYSDAKWLKGKKRGRRMTRFVPDNQENNHNVSGLGWSKKTGDNVEEEEEEEEVEEVDASIRYALTSEVVGIPSATEFLEKSPDEGPEDEGEVVLEREPLKLAFACDERMRKEFKKYKSEYYKEKLEIEDIDDDLMQSFANKYVEALQWILHYYCNGIQSWSWFYPYHYAPFLSDVQNFSHLKLTFDMGQPFLPFQQLMAVLPKASSQLLPAAFRKLMEPGSPIEEYYPEDFKTDLNGKVQEWEAVVLIPFIDEMVLLRAMEPLYETLTSEEKKRNRHGPHNLVCFRESKELEFYRLKGAHPEEDGKILKWNLPADYFALKVGDLYKGLCNGVNLRSLFYGFPTLRHVPHKGSLQLQGVRVFNRNSSNPSMILTLTPQKESSIDQISKDLIGRVTFVDWPHLCEALVVEISSDEIRFHPKVDFHQEVDRPALEQSEINVEEQADWHREAEFLKEKYLTRFGIDIGETHLLVGARRLVGKKFIVKRSGEVMLEKCWSSTTERFLYQTSIEYSKGRHPDAEEHYQLTDFFQKGETIFLLANPHYGCEGKVLEVLDYEHPRILAQFLVPEEPNLGKVRAMAAEFESSFMASYLAAQRLGISSHLLSRITGTIYLKKDANDSGKLNIGLNLKMTKQNKEMPGYTKRIGKDWLYSNKVIDLVGEYMDEFPDLFEAISAMTNNDNFFVSDIFKENGLERFAELESFLKSKMKSLDLKPVGTRLLEAELIEEIEKEVGELSSKGLVVKMKVKPNLLYVPKIVHSPCALDELTTFELFDRVINIRPGFTVPLGLRGTLVGIEPGEKGQDYLYHVLFDKEFDGAMPMRCSSSKCYRVPATSLVNITHGMRTARRASSKRSTGNVNQSSFRSRPNGFAEDSPSTMRVLGSRARGGTGKPVTSTNVSEDIQDKSEALHHGTTVNAVRNCSEDAYAQAWDRLKQGSNVKREEPKIKILPSNKAAVRPVPPSLKPPQAWIDKSNMEHNGQQNVQKGKKISVDDLMKTAESEMQKVSINGHSLPQQQHQQSNMLPQYNHNHHHHQQRQQQQLRQNDHQRQQHSLNQQQNHGQQQQQPFNHHQQQQWMFPNNNPQQNSLVFFCQASGLPTPKYEIRSIDGGFQGRVHVQGKGWFTGPICGDEFRAIEVVSGFALHNIKLQKNTRFNGPSTNVGQYNPQHNMGHQTGPRHQLANAAGPSALNPQANTFIPTQVLLKQKSTNRPTCPALDPRTPIEDAHPVQAEAPKLSEVSKQPEAKDAPSKPNSRKVTKHRKQHKRIAASFAIQRAT